MKTRISTILAAAALMIVLATTPAYAIFGPSPALFSGRR